MKLSHLIPETDEFGTTSTITASTQSNPEDKVLLDIPLLIRLLEWAKEDAKDDMQLHKVAEKLTELSKNGAVLSMDNYDKIVSCCS